MYRDLPRSATLVIVVLVAGLACPVAAQDAVDTDGDGLADAEEAIIGTSPTQSDTDGDGLLDGWEVYGFSRAGYFEPLHEYGADPLRKDVFVEIDWMETSRGSVIENAGIAYRAAVDISRVFERSGTGIRIHFDLGPDIAQWVPPEQLAADLDFGFAGAADPAKTIPYRDAFPARPGCRGPGGGLSLYEVYNHPRYFRPSRRNLFYYVVIAEQAEPLADLALDDRPNALVDSFADETARRDGLRGSGVYSAVVYRRPVGADRADVVRYRYSSTVMHELGHAFGLGHGGALPNGRWDQTNDKVNYVSVMNYRYVFWGVDIVDSIRRMDFSHGRFDYPLREYELHEHLGMGALPNAHIRENLLVSHLENSPFQTNLDWNRDGKLSGRVRRDLNGNGVIDDAVFTDHDDWGKFQRDGFDGIGLNAFRGCGLGCARGEDVLRILGDLDGSGFEDVVLLRADTLAVAIAPGDGTIEIDSRGIARGVVGEWPLAAGDSIVVGDFLGEGRDVLFVQRRDEAALLGYRAGRLDLRWSARRELRGTVASWRLGAADQILKVRLRPAAPQLAMTDGESIGVVAGDGATGDLSVLWRMEIRTRNDPEYFVLEQGRSFADGTGSFFARSDANLIEVSMPSDDDRVIQEIAPDGGIEGISGEKEAWRLAHDDCLFPIDLDGDRKDEILIVGVDRLGVIDWTIGGPRLAWKAEARIGQPDREWRLPETRRVLHGRFDGAAGELVVLVSDTRMATLAWNAEKGRVDVVGLQFTQNGPIEAWEFHPTARILVDRFLPEHPEMILVQHDRGIFVLAYSKGAPESHREAGFYLALEASGNLDQWSFSADDVMVAGDFDTDAEREVFVRKGDLMGILDFHPEPHASFISRLDEASFALGAAPTFLRGDVDNNRTVDLSDAVVLLNFLFLEKVALDCEDAADVDDSGAIDLSDPVNLLEFQFAGGTPPAPPGAVTPGIDPTVDGLSCGE